MIKWSEEEKKEYDDEENSNENEVGAPFTRNKTNRGSERRRGHTASPTSSAPRWQRHPLIHWLSLPRERIGNPLT